MLKLTIGLALRGPQNGVLGDFQGGGGKYVKSN